jgi:hypothetical protein
MGGIGMNSFARQFGQYSSRQQMANALGHDLEGEYDYETKKLYPISNRPPRYFTIKYVYDFESVEDVHEVDWQNIIIRLAIAIAKINLGQIRTDHIDKGSLWEDNGAEYLERGMNEHDAIIEELKQKGRHPIFKGDK